MFDLKYEDVREELRKWREDNSRHSEEVVDMWDCCVKQNRNKLGDERWMVEEQVFIAALDCNRSDIAKQCLESLGVKFPDSLRVLKLRGMKLEAEEKYDEALQHYDVIIKHDETNSTARKRKVSVLRAQNKYPEAIKELTEYLNTFMSDVEAWQELTDLYLKEGDYGKASFCMEELLLTNPHNSIYYTRYAEIKYTQGGFDNLELAKIYFSQAVQFNKKNVRALLGLQLSCQQLAANNKISSQKKKEAIKVAEYAGQQVKERYESVLPLANKSTEDIISSLSSLTV